MDLYDLLLRVRYDDRTQVDKVSAVQAQVDRVQGVMQDNIKVVLANADKVQAIESKTGMQPNFCFPPKCGS
jgi:hypothetical protein